MARKKQDPILSSECALCPEKVQFVAGGFSCLYPFKGAKGVVCAECTRQLSMAWAREYKRRNFPVFTPTPTNSPAGAGTARVEALEAVA